jgi:NADPH:quinone reductase-like Zn-dependent oxidoreductase
MRAAFTPTYGPADVLVTRDAPKPVLGAHDVLVQIHASTVTAGDVRLRTADFRSITALPGRLMIGVRRPKQPIQGTMFAGRIVDVGAAVTRHAIGEDVFGSTMHGAYAEYLSIPEDGAMARMPAATRYEEAAAVPYGAVSSLRFLREVGAVRPGDEVVIVGASGGVGRFAVQLAKHLGATVTAVCGRRSFELVRALGADHVIDHETEDFTQNGRRYDVIFDTADATSFSQARASLTPHGRYLSLFVSVGLLLQMAWTSMIGGPRAKFALAMGDAADMDEVRALVERGIIRPTIGERFSLEHIAEAHAAAEMGRNAGSVVVTMADG